jgi:hypothetical protein
MSEQGFLNAYFDKDTDLVIEAEQYNCMPQHRCFFKSNNVSILHFTITKTQDYYLRIQVLAARHKQHVQHMV